MSLIQSFSHDYRRWNRSEQIISKLVLVLTGLGITVTVTGPLIGG
jgi:hypothetical protein